MRRGGRRRGERRGVRRGERKSRYFFSTGRFPGKQDDLVSDFDDAHSGTSFPNTEHTKCYKKGAYHQVTDVINHKICKNMNCAQQQCEHHH